LLTTETDLNMIMWNVGGVMKKFLIILGLILFSGSFAQARNTEVFDYVNMNMNNFWQLDGKDEQKVIDIGTKILNANKIDKRVAFQTNRSTSVINANSALSNKVVTVYYGLLPYLDNDDELAAVLGHETAHALDAYGGFFKWINIICNEKEYEYKAD